MEINVITAAETVTVETIVAGRIVRSVEKARCSFTVAGRRCTSGTHTGRVHNC